jgi:hypothetical protein
MIGSVPDKILDNNGLYMRLKIVNAEKVSEITQLKDKLATVEKELEATTIRCESFRCVTFDSGLLYAINTPSSNIIDRFAKEHHDHTCKAGNGTSVSLSDVPPYLPLDPREDHPAVDFWTREDYNRAEADQQTGETNGDVPVDNPEQPPPNRTGHYYLQHHDGSQVSKRQVAALSYDSRALWMTLLEQKRAPVTFGKMSSSAWEFFSRMVLANPDHAFLRLCDDGQWKLREWATQNYSSWALNIGLRQKKSRKPKNEPLNDPALIRMSSTERDAEDKDNDGERKDNDDSVDADNDGRSSDESTQGDDDGNTPPQVQPVRQSHVALNIIYPITVLGLTPARSSNIALQGSIVTYLSHRAT